MKRGLVSKIGEFTVFYCFRSKINYKLNYRLANTLSSNHL